MAVSHWLAGSLAAYLLMSPTLAQTQDEPLWTSKAVRVDPSRQNLERLPAKPDEFPLKLRVRQSVIPTDSTSFISDGRTFRLAGIQAITSDSICAAADGSRWPCGLRARLALRKLIAGRLIDCRMLSDEGHEATVVCVQNGRDVAASIVRSGNAFAVRDSPYIVDQATAHQHMQGLWHDSTCYRVWPNINRDCTFRKR